MCTAVWLFLLVIVVPNSRAQFKIIGLLEDSTNAEEAPAQSEIPLDVSEVRGFIDHEPSSTTPSSLIKIRFMDEADEVNNDFNEKVTPPEHTLRITDDFDEVDVEPHRNVVSVIPKSYSRAIQPNIRKFSYIEERSFHKNGVNQNHLAARKNSINLDYKFKKVTKYRNNFKTKCRCERISNCPKIQITIHRCEQDYFMCCF